MGAIYERNFTISSCNPATTLFNAVAIDYANVIPSAAPWMIQRIVKVLGESSDIQQIHFAPGYKFTFVRTEVLVQNFPEFRFEITDGDAIDGVFSNIEVVITLEEKPNGQSTFVANVTFYAIKGGEEAEKRADEGMEKAKLLFNAVNAYLLHQLI